MKLTQERLKELLNYDPETGVFTWQISIGNVKAGKIAGSYIGGYKKIAIYGKNYLAHRLAWLYISGYFPEHEIDHINRIKDDNRISNLREVSRNCNLRNRDKNKNNKSGVVGVSFRSNYNAWRSQISDCGKTIHIGLFKSFDDAVKSRWEAEVKYGFPDCCSDSSAYNYLKGKGLI